MEKSLGRIAGDAFESSVRSVSDPDLWEETAAAVKKAVLARLEKDEEEPISGQELNHYQVLRWIEKHGSTKGLQYMSLTGLWVGDENTLNRVVDTDIRYRVALNDPDDPTTWEKGVAVLCRDWEDDSWVLDSFVEYDGDGSGYIFRCEDCGWMFAKLATPKQVEAWKLINEDL